MISLLFLIYSLKEFRKVNRIFNRNVHHGEHFAVFHLLGNNTG